SGSFRIQEHRKALGQILTLHQQILIERKDGVESRQEMSDCVCGIALELEIRTFSESLIHFLKHLENGAYQSFDILNCRLTLRVLNKLILQIAEGIFKTAFGFM